VIKHEAVRHPQQLEPTLIDRQHAGQIDGMMALYERDALMKSGEAVLVGHDAIRRFFAADIAAGKKYSSSVQQEALICGELALTSTRLPDGTVTAEVSRRQADGSWRWVIDCFKIANEREATPEST
jgi:ketosteroid isomerase-like protein